MQRRIRPSRTVGSSTRPSPGEAGAIENGERAFGPGPILLGSVVAMLGEERPCL